jgi:hypothetical protein
MLATHPDHVAKSLPRVQPQAHRQAGLRADRMPCLELRDLVVGSAMVAARPGQFDLDACGRIADAQLAVDASPEQVTDCLQPIAPHIRRHAAKQAVDESRYAAITRNLQRTQTISAQGNTSRRMGIAAEAKYFIP